MAVTIRRRLRSAAGWLFGLRDCLTERGILMCLTIVMTKDWHR